GEIQEVRELFHEQGSDEEAEEYGDEEEEYEDEYEDDEEELEALFEEVPFEEGVWLADDEEEEEEEDEDRPAASSKNRSERPSEVDMDEIICRLHPSILAYPKLLLVTAILGAVAFFFLFIAPSLGLPGGTLGGMTIAFACATLAILLILRHFDCYIISRGRADVDKEGLLGLLNVGDVKLSSAGTGGFDVVFAKVRAGHKVKKILRRVQKDPQSPKRRLLHGKTWLRR
ncbi:MAG: hypothetical protein ACKVHP_07960, partial [Verrucomicrobiales bacterium]